MNFKTIIIDDDLNGIQAIENIINTFNYPAEIVGTAQNIKDGIVLLNQHKPDLLFLDIEMKNETGFDLLDIWENERTKIIFCTGYDEYAIKALKNGAYDYILKPLDYKEFGELFKKLNSDSTPINKVEDESRLTVKSLGGIHVIDYCDINFLKADGRYTEIHYGESKTCVSSKNLGFYSENLKCARFSKINKSLIINQDKLIGVEKKGSKCFAIFKQAELEISDGVRKIIMKMIE